MVSFRLFQKSGLFFFHTAPHSFFACFVSRAIHAIAYTHSADFRFLPSPFTLVCKVLMMRGEGVKEKDEKEGLVASREKEQTTEKMKIFRFL